VQEMPAAGGQARDVLEDDQRHRVIRPGFAHQPDAAQGQLVERLVLRGLAHLLGEQAAGALAWRADEYGVRALALGGTAHVFRGRLAPTRWWLLPVEADVLVAGEKIQQGARRAGQAGEVGQACRVHIDTAQAFPACLDVADYGPSAVEALGAAAQAAAEVEVVQRALDHAADSLSP